MTSLATFIVLSFLIQQAVQIVRERYKRLDGHAVLGVACLLAVAVAALTPEARIGAVLVGTLPVWLDVILSGITMTLGAKGFRDFYKATATSLVKPAPKSDPEP